MNGLGRQDRSGRWAALLAGVHRALAGAQRRQRPWQCLGLRDDTAALRVATWHVGAAPAWLRERTVELLVPAHRAPGFLQHLHEVDSIIVDFDDTFAPSVENLAQAAAALTELGHARLPCSIGLRPRPAWLRDPLHRVDGEPAIAAAVDIATFLSACAQQARFFLSLPKVTGVTEAVAWEQALTEVEQLLGFPHATIRVNLQIELVSAVFELDEILWALRDRAVSVTIGRWDYVASVARAVALSSAMVLPPAETLSSTCGFLRAYLEQVVAVAQRRGLLALGGVVMTISGSETDSALLERQREAELGYRGAWTNDPSTAPAIRALFRMATPQRTPREADEELTHALWDLPTVERVSAAAVHQSIRQLGAFLAAWQRGEAVVVSSDRVEDLSTAEVRRAQLWQWLHHSVQLEDGGRFDHDRYRRWRDASVPLEARQALDDLLMHAPLEMPLPAVLTPGCVGSASQ